MLGLNISLNVLSFLLLRTLFTVDFDLVKLANKYQLTKLPSKDNESAKYLKKATIQRYLNKNSVFLQSFLKIFSKEAFLNFSRKVTPKKTNPE